MRSERSEDDEDRERGRTGRRDRGYRKAREGLVVSDKMDKTVVVAGRGPGQAPAVRQGDPPHQEVQGARRAANAGGVGDRVLLMETRPLSATKRWRVAEILEKAK